MSLEIYSCEQNSPEWYSARLGIPTASMFATVQAKGKDGGASLTRAKYLKQLAGERICGEPMENYSNAYMERGKAMEDDARSLYQFVHDAPLTRVGFIRNGDYGCSPDSLIGEDGVLEIKSAAPHILIDYLLKDQFPPEHVAQCQGALMVTGRAFVDICIYYPKMPLFVKRAQRDEAYIAQLRGAIEQFNTELAEIVSKVRAKAS